VESIAGISAVRTPLRRWGAKASAEGQAEGQAGFDRGPRRVGFVAGADQDECGRLHGAGDDHAADRDDDAGVGGDDAEGQQGAEGGCGGDRCGRGRDGRGPGQAGGSLRGDPPGEQHHHREPARCSGPAGVVEDQQQDCADGRQLESGADGGDRDVPGQVQAAAPGEENREPDQRRRGGDPCPGGDRRVHAPSFR